MTPAIKAFEDEIEKTAVISDSFKKTLRARLYEAVREAYERGVESERSKTT